VSSRDPFANFDRMRREMDELFGDALERSGIPRRRVGRWPAVDVTYAADPPRAIVTAELAGVHTADIELHVEGRRLILAGRRASPSPEGEVYQQIEIERGAFRRVLELGADVDAEQVRARYEDGMLRVELPLLARGPRSRAVPIEGPDEAETAIASREPVEGRIEGG
jgi:HSP20 family protein